MSDLTAGQPILLQFFEIPTGVEVENIEVLPGGMFATAPADASTDARIGLDANGPEVADRQTWMFSEPEDDGAHKIWYSNRHNDNTRPDVMYGFTNPEGIVPSVNLEVSALPYRIWVRGRTEQGLLVTMHPNNLLISPATKYFVGVDSATNKLQCQTVNVTNLPEKVPGWIVKNASG